MKKCDWQFCCQKRGLSKLIIKKVMDFILNDLNKSKIRLSGQVYLKDFYHAFGFKIVSDEYLEDGIKHLNFYVRHVFLFVNH